MMSCRFENPRGIVLNPRSPVVLIILTSIHIARLKSLRFLRPQWSSQIKRDARSSSTIVHYYRPGEDGLNGSVARID
jgi:hypothetical protein